LAWAHAAADLGGPSPEGRFPSPDVWIGEKNPHAQLGMTETFASQEASGLCVEACPGFPACRKCGVLLAAPHFILPHVVTRCETCGASSRYAIGQQAAAFAQALRGVVSEEQRVDRRDVQVHAAETGLVSLTCPQCGAALKASGEPTIECAYCRTLA